MDFLQRTPARPRAQFAAELAAVFRLPPAFPPAPRLALRGPGAQSGLRVLNVWKTKQKRHTIMTQEHL